MLERKAERNNVRLAFELPDDLPPIFCDGGKLGQVITNLLVNAIKFSGDNGRVKLWARRDDPHRVIVGVSDDGPGIETDKLRLIFERFTQLENAHRKQHQRSWVGAGHRERFCRAEPGRNFRRQHPGNGSTFSFALPQADFRAVMECYLDALRKQDAEATVATFEARVVQPYDPAVLPVVDEFLQRNLRPDDLAYMTSPGQWRMFSRCSPMRKTIGWNKSIWPGPKSAAIGFTARRRNWKCSPAETAAWNALRQLAAAAAGAAACQEELVTHHPDVPPGSTARIPPTNLEEYLPPCIPPLNDFASSRCMVKASDCCSCWCRRC